MSDAADPQHAGEEAPSWLSNGDDIEPTSTTSPSLTPPANAAADANATVRDGDEDGNVSNSNSSTSSNSGGAPSLVEAHTASSKPPAQEGEPGVNGAAPPTTAPAVTSPLSSPTLDPEAIGSFPAAASAAADVAETDNTTQAAAAKTRAKAKKDRTEKKETSGGRTSTDHTPPPQQQPRRSTAIATQRQRSHFDKKGGVSCVNYYYHDEDITSIGVGTVGLYAAKTTPASITAGVSTLANTNGIAAAAAAAPLHHHHHHAASGAAHGAGAATTAAGGGGHKGGGVTGAPVEPKYRTVPSPQGEVTAWDRKQANYQNWKSEHLAASSYARLSQVSHPAPAGDGGAAMMAASFGGSQNAMGLPELWMSEEQRRLERRRLRGLEAEREAQAQLRQQARASYDSQVLQHRTRKLNGEAVDLPDAYLRATYPDPSAPKGYADPPLSTHTAAAHHTNTNGSGGKSSSSSKGGKSTALHGVVAPLPLVELDTSRVVKDHLRAGQLHRADLQQRHLNEEARRQESAEKQRQTVAAQLEQRREQEEAFREEWMSGRPRVSRSRADQRRAEQDADKLSTAQLLHSAKVQERELYSLYARQEAVERTARQKALRRRVLTRPHSPRGQLAAEKALPTSTTSAGSGATSGRIGKKKAPPPPQQQQQCSTAATGRAAPPPPTQTTSSSAAGGAASAGVAAAHGKPVSAEQQERMTRPVSPAPPSQLVGPTSTNFFNELKTWTQEFPSPNLAPLNAAETAHRRAWKAEMEEEHLRFNREATQRQREEHPRKVQEAREKTQEANWANAEHERREKKTFASRRADMAQADLLAATAMREEVQLEAQRALQQRLVHSAERRDEAQQQRLLSKQREEVLRSIEAEELQQLRLVVSAGGTRH